VRITFSHPAPEGERFAPDCFAAVTGTTVTFGNFAGVPVTEGILSDAVVLPGGESAEITAEIPDDSPVAQEISRQGGGGPGPFHVYDDGVIGVPFEIRRRDPAEAARLIREGYREHGIPDEIAEAMIEETLKP
jgi:hypothetical protein